MMMGQGKGLDGKHTNCAVTVGFARPSSPVGVLIWRGLIVLDCSVMAARVWLFVAVFLGVK